LTAFRTVRIFTVKPLKGLDMFSAVDIEDIARVRADHASFAPGTPVEDCFGLADEGEDEALTLLKIWSVEVILRLMSVKRARRLLRLVLNDRSDPEVLALAEHVSNAIEFIETEDGEMQK
jgi:hypothetical protein